MLPGTESPGGWSRKRPQIRSISVLIPMPMGESERHTSAWTALSGSSSSLILCFMACHFKWAREGLLLSSSFGSASSTFCAMNEITSCRSSSVQWVLNPLRKNASTGVEKTIPEVVFVVPGSSKSLSMGPC